MHTFKSGVLFGVGEDAAYLADRINITGWENPSCLVQTDTASAKEASEPHSTV
jgi:hypothetical protein